MVQLFHKLVKISISGVRDSSFAPDINEWRELYSIAKRQSVLGICFSGVSCLVNPDEGDYAGMDKALYHEWLATSFKILKRNELLDRQCMELQKRFSDDGFRSCILKGQGVAKLYGDLSTLRQSGDIDIWIDAPKERVLGYIMNIAPSKHFDQKHIHFHCFKGTDVEVHWYPAFWYASPKNRVLQEYFESVRDREFANGGYPTAEFQLAHQLLHLYGHYMYEGVGLRQVMDLFYAQMACADGLKRTEDFQTVTNLFEKLGLMTFVAGTQWVLRSVFDMPDDSFLCAPNENEGRKLFEEMLKGGNFGHFNKNYRANEGVVRRFIRRMVRRYCLFRFDPIGVLLTPLARIRLEVWMRKVRKQYGLC